MADKSTIARPYARAAFEEAKANNRLAAWSEALRLGAAVVQDERVQKLLGNPHVTPKQLAELVLEIAGPQLDEPGRNFVQTLADNHRLAYLPEIAEIFDELKDAEEGIVDVTVTSAAPLDDEQRRTLADALARKLKREVRLHCDIDKSLIGGAVLRAGDLVIDGSLRSRLDRIAYELTA
ncbi:MAG: F0F1 ATP synthase subunit delta [Steroidobacteraceae bacterium]|nr:F0F1 ATP synthase subunit delta [Steroidobacteraceae bacterium]